MALEGKPGVPEYTLDIAVADRNILALDIRLDVSQERIFFTNVELLSNISAIVVIFPVFQRPIS